MEFLQHLEDRGYPVEYLLSRIRGRRSRLITDWRPLIYDAAPLDYLVSARYQGFVRERTPEGIWRSLVKEYRWVYCQMNGELRDIFWPFFLYTELRTIFICLRHINDQKAGRAGELLAVSLLSDEIKEILSVSADTRTAVEGIERVFLYLKCGGLVEAFEAEGLRGVEHRLTDTYLAVIVEGGLHPLMKSFFVRLIDSRNIMSMYKYMRLERKIPPPIIPGGAISEARLRAVLEKDDIFGVRSLVRDFSGIKMEAPDPTKVEVALYKGITRYLRKAGRVPFGAGPIFDYLWKCSLEVINLSVLFHGKDLEREAVMAELVQ